MRCFRFALLVFACSVAASFSSAAEWFQFRGPGGEGHAEGTNVPTTWSETQNIVWKTEIPGKGWSSPVVHRGLTWMTTAIVTELTPEQIEEIKRSRLSGNNMADQMDIVGPIKLYAVAVDNKTGKVVHNTLLFEVAEPEPVHALNSYASPSPVAVDGKVYCHFGKFGTACVDCKSGKPVWKKELVIAHSVGPGSSPILYDDLLIVHCDGTDLQYVIAMNRDTGEQVWKTDRPKLTGSLGEMHKAFSTPLVVNIGGQDQLISVGAQWFVAYEPRTGKEIWRLHHGDGFSNVPRPVFANDMLFLATGFMTPELLAIRTDGHGDISDTHTLWRCKKQVPSMSSPIVVGGEIYFVSDQGVLTCLDTQTGEQVWQKRLKGNFCASPIFVDGKIYIGSREGETTVFLPGRQFTEVATPVLSGQLMASPAVLDNTLLVRTDTHLYRIGQ